MAQEIGVVKYLLEDRTNSLWLKMGEPFVHEYRMGVISGGEETKWTNDANEAIQWGNQEEAQAYRERFYNLPGYEITEHEFI